MQYYQDCAAQGKDGSLPLHLAVSNKVDAEVVERIESAFPLERWRLGDAARLQALPPALQPKVFALITPEACTAKDEQGRLPLHLAVDHEAPAQVVDRLREASGLHVALQR